MRENDLPVAFEDVELLTETAKAIEVLVDGEVYWVPKSCVYRETTIKEEGDIGELIIQEWVAVKNGLM